MVELRKAFYSPGEVAGFLDVSTDTILNYIHAEKLFAIQLSARTYRIPQRAVARLLGLPVGESGMIEESHGGGAVADRIRERVHGEERTPVAR